MVDVLVQVTIAGASDTDEPLTFDTSLSWTPAQGYTYLGGAIRRAAGALADEAVDELRLEALAEPPPG